MNFRLFLLCVLFVFSTPATQAEECDELDIATELFASPNPQMAEMRRSVEQMKQPQSELLVIGDSMARRWPSPDLSSVFGMSVANFGLEGERVQNVLWRLADIAAQQPNAKNVVLWLGTNNLTMGEKACAIVAGVMEVVFRVRETWPDAQITLVGIAPRGFPRLDWREGDRQAINAQLQKAQIAAGYRFLESDFLRCSASTEDIADLRPYFDCPSYHRDYLHLSEVGYGLLTAQLRRRL